MRVSKTIRAKTTLFVLFSLFTSIGCTQGGGGPEILNNPSGSLLDASEKKTENFLKTFKQHHAEEKLIYHVGPVDLRAGQVASVMFEEPEKLNFQVKEPFWVLSFSPQVVDSDGNALPGHLLYKALLLNKHESNPICASGNGGNPFAVATGSLTKVDLPEGFGYPLLPDDPLEARVIFHNPTDQDYLGVFFTFELTVVPMEEGKGFRDVQAILLDTDPCEYKPIALEPGSFVEENKTFTLQKGGNLMVANGHLSNYGVAVSLSHQNEKEPSLIPFWRAEAEVDADHQIINLTPNPFVDAEGKKIESGDKLTLGVTFDNFSDNWNNEASGGAMIYMAPNDKP